MTTIVIVNLCELIVFDKYSFMPPYISDARIIMGVFLCTGTVEDNINSN